VAVVEKDGFIYNLFPDIGNIHSCFKANVEEYELRILASYCR